MRLYQIWFYVPASHKEAVKKAVFKAGAGQVGHYSHCSWEVLGQGQFLPLPGSQPCVGQVGCLLTQDEYRVEVVVEAAKLKAALQAMISAHPYEVPAYGCVPLQNV